MNNAGVPVPPAVSAAVPGGAPEPPPLVMPPVPVVPLVAPPDLIFDANANYANANIPNVGSGGGGASGSDHEPTAPPAVP